MLILIFGATPCQDVNSLANSIARRNTVECQAIGFAGSSSTQYKRFEKIKRKGSKEELISLTKHDSLAVVVYASYALIDKELIEPSVLLGDFDFNETQKAYPCGHTILRVEGSKIKVKRILTSVKKLGYSCEILQDKVCI